MATIQLPPGVDLCLVPAAMPPPGVVPNFDNPESLATAIIAVTVVMLTISTIFLAVRVFTNFPKYNSADYFAFIGFLLNIVYTGVLLSVTEYSRHQWNVPVCWYTASYMKILFAQGVMLGPVIFFLKTAIWLLYLQIFSAHRTIRIIVYVGIVVTALTYWTTVPLELAYGCPTPGTTWTDLLTDGKPAKLIYYGPVQGSLAVIIDICIFVLPLPVLWKLNMTLRKRIALCAVFFTALLGVISSVVALRARVKLFGTSDLTWLESQLFICIIVENNIALIVCCVPSFNNGSHSSRNSGKSDHRYEGKGGYSPNSRGEVKRLGSHQIIQGYSLNRDSSKETYEHKDSLEESNRCFTSYGQGAGSSDYIKYPSRVVQIEGGINREQTGADAANARSEGIMRSFEIRQEVHPEDVV
ncbi:hypothetical protein BBK36DRAFT_2315 [Trichoderma citrinoviride]|uniref:Rhodopsin domain-containing protein n=1 Tax=Trichoderma citrinoviride TaxID=58853 RepID=A0A2T4BI74_9HYPO|nr:hypothetical protein BBK36DRAFT_2315 [Trichoderma citrinoviride]PTB68949.1 hypothetical protein BBK36DRAFT_2315 [Trichoderma citrinoviride]